MNIIKNINLENYDLVVVGSGFAGSLSAVENAKVGKKVLVIEKRSSVAGNMFDEYDENNILVQRFGPHILRDNEDFIYDYLSEYSDFYHYRHIVFGKINDNLNIPLPFNLNSLKLAFPDKYEEYKEILIKEYGHETKIGKKEFIKLGMEDLYEFISNNIFVNYTKKQWKMYADKIDLDAVLNRVPMMVLTHRDGYFNHKNQKMPSQGFTKMFENMLAHKNIDVVLNTDFMDIATLDESNIYINGNLVECDLTFTGPIDELFGYKYGQLPYLSVDFEYTTYNQQNLQHPGTQNYPNEFDYTRESEFKNMTNQELDNSITKTVTVKERSQNFELGKNERFYPIPGDEFNNQYNKYKLYSQNYSKLHLLGRLAEYKYYDMDVVIKNTLAYWKNIIK